MKKLDEDTKNSIIEHKGSIQQLTGLPKHVRDKYKIVWEIPMKHMINMARDRGAYICQSQSLNIFAENPTYKLLTNIHFYGWKKGLKTGSYYIRSKAASHFQRFTIDPTLEKQFKEQQRKLIEENDKKECIACSG